MIPFEELKEQLLAYLHAEQDMEKSDIERQKTMTTAEKVEANVLLPGLVIEKSLHNLYVLSARENYSKLRSGDKVLIRQEGADRAAKAMVLDTFTDSITIECNAELDKNAVFEIETESPNLLQSLIGCLAGIMPGTPGAAFLRNLSGEEAIETEDYMKLEPEEISGYQKIFSSLNTDSQSAVRSMLEFPSIHVLQGPPGTGKTHVLAATAIGASLSNREVVIIANTHHAVNNALLSIHEMNGKIPLFKIGEELKADELGEAAIKFSGFKDYNEYSRKNKRKKKFGYVVGMTIWGAITNLGLRQHGHFRPYFALVDEASLMPLTYASILGKCATSICLFGDSRQMPPIFRPELETHRFSQSILDFCANNVEGIKVSVLPVTYRMNDEITSVISKSFYEPHGIKLICSEQSLGKRFKSQYFSSRQLDGSLVYIKPETGAECKEENKEEAKAVIALVSALLAEGRKPTDIAVITPFRKQVRTLRECANEVIPKKSQPLIDTVERLQGQDVECIILSFATSSDTYLNEMKPFLFNENRLNVMISRAKTKVVIFGSAIVQEELKKILVIS